MANMAIVRKSLRVGRGRRLGCEALGLRGSRGRRGRQLRRQRFTESCSHGALRRRDANISGTGAAGAETARVNASNASALIRHGGASLRASVAACFAAARTKPVRDWPRSLAARSIKATSVSVNRKCIATRLGDRIDFIRRSRRWTLLCVLTNVCVSVHDGVWLSWGQSRACHAGFLVGVRSRAWPSCLLAEGGRTIRAFFVILISDFPSLRGARCCLAYRGHRWAGRRIRVGVVLVHCPMALRSLHPWIPPGWA